MIFDCPTHGLIDPTTNKECPYCNMGKVASIMGDLSIRPASKDRVPGTFSEGRKNDADKCRIELFPPEAIFGPSYVLTQGAIKYEDRNWEKGMKWGRVFGALLRHLWAWWGSDLPTKHNFAFGDLDDEWQYSHLWHAGCCLAFLIAYESRKVGEDDRPYKFSPAPDSDPEKDR